MESRYDPPGALTGLEIAGHGALTLDHDAAGRELRRASAAGFVQPLLGGQGVVEDALPLARASLHLGGLEAGLGSGERDAPLGERRLALGEPGLERRARREIGGRVELPDIVGLRPATGPCCRRPRWCCRLDAFQPTQSP